jgi:uncharacterized protein YjbJ (UPF0337 family)
MNKDIVKSTNNEILGRAKQKAGELTGNTSLQVEGIAQQVKGTLENTRAKWKMRFMTPTFKRIHRNTHGRRWNHPRQTIEPGTSE